MKWKTWSYFRWISSSVGGLTYGKVYEISCNDGKSLCFFDDTGQRQQWYFPIVGVERVSFEEILEIKKQRAAPNMAEDQERIAPCYQPKRLALAKVIKKAGNGAITACKTINSAEIAIA